MTYPGLTSRHYYSEDPWPPLMISVGRVFKARSLRYLRKSSYASLSMVKKRTRPKVRNIDVGFYRWVSLDIAYLG